MLQWTDTRDGDIQVYHADIASAKREENWKIGNMKIEFELSVECQFRFSHLFTVLCCPPVDFSRFIVTLDLYDANRWQWNGFLNIFFVIFVLMHFWLVVLANVRRKTMMNCFQSENVSSTSTFCGSKVPGLYICSTNVANFTSAVIIEFQYQHLIVSKTHSIVDWKSRTNALSSRLLTISSNTMHCRDIQQWVRLWSCSQPAGYTRSSMIQSNDWTNGKYHNTTTLSCRFLFLCDMRTTQTDRYMEEFWISMFELLNWYFSVHLAVRDRMRLVETCLSGRTAQPSLTFNNRSD